MKIFLVTFAAGCVGGAVMCIVMWLCTRYGVTHSLGVNINGSLSPHWMYPRIIWGGLWGFLFVFPFLSGKWLARSLVISLVPTLVHLFIIYPYYQGRGIAGLSLGILTPLVVLFFFWVWSLTTILTLRVAK